MYYYFEKIATRGTGNGQQWYINWMHTIPFMLIHSQQNTEAHTEPQYS